MLLPAAAARPLLATLLATTTATGSGLPTLLPRSVAPAMLLRGPLPVAGGQLDLELVQLVPFGIGTLPFGNRL